MKIFNNIKLALAGLLALSAFGLTSCEEEQNGMALAVAASSDYMIFEAKSAEPQVLSIYADGGSWEAECPDWVTMEPMYGDGPMDVTITVADNVNGGVTDSPRKDVIILKGRYVARDFTISVNQKGDTYKGVAEYTVSEVAALEKETVAKITGSQVVALAKDGFLITDGSAIIMVLSNADVAVGDKLFLNGETAVFNGLPAFKGDEVNVLSSAEFTYPEAQDITEDLDKFESDKPVYVSVSGTLVGTALKNIAGSPAKGVSIVAPHSSLDLTAVNVRKVTLKGYYVGSDKSGIYLVATSVKDNGEDTEIGVDFPFRDDFSWLAPYIAAANEVLPAKEKITDCVGEVNNSADGAANIYTTLVNNNIPVLEELRKRGYTDLNPAMKTIYMQDAYFKFGATDKQSGLILPLMKMEGEQDIQVSFRWCCHLSGALNVDDVKLVVAIDGPGTVVTADGKENAKVSDKFVSKQQKGQMFWNDAAVMIQGATKATFITIRPEPIGAVTGDVEGVHRYYLDDIAVVSAADAAEAEIEVEGLENDLITFEGSPEGPATFKVKSTKDFFVSSPAKWLVIDPAEGAADAEQTVTVTCEPSTLSTLRQSNITIKSGSSTRTISVVQSAAGQELDPFVTLTSGNSITVLGEGAEFSARVQFNTEYEVECVEPWIEEIETASTQALVEWKEHSFKAKVNDTGVAREGHIRFFNAKYNIESVLVVTQDHFEPRIDVYPAVSGPGVSGKGGKMNVTIDSSIPYNITTDASWIKFPAASGTAGVVEVPVTIEANPSSEMRSATVTFTNENYDYVKTIELAQYPAGIIFQDDFSWLKPMNDGYYEKTGVHPGDAVGTVDKDTDSPNMYSNAPYSDKVDGGVTRFVKALTDAGYEDMNPSEKLMYAQEQYLKFSRTGGHNTAIRLSGVSYLGAASATIEFDYCAQLQGGGTVDASDILIVIEGDGTFDNGTKYSDIQKITQKTGEMFWQHASARINNPSENTKLVLVMSRVVNTSTGAYNWGVSGAGRWYLDNIVIK